MLINIKFYSILFYSNILYCATTTQIGHGTGHSIAQVYADCSIVVVSRKRESETYFLSDSNDRKI